MKRLPPEQLGSLVDEKVRKAIECFAEHLAHDFNNIITPLLAYPEMLVSLLSDERCVKLVRGIQESAEHAMEITQRLAALAGGGQEGGREFDLSAVAAKAVAAVRQQLAGVDHIAIHESLADVCPVTMQQESFVRALEALLENAIRAVDSTGHGGEIRVTGEKVQLAGLVGIGGESIPAGAYTMLAVTDTGVGISPEDLTYIVEPFFTGLIKSPGCGSGLGLSVAYCGLRRNGAYLQIENVPQGGTRAAMYFPVCRSEMGAGPASAPRPPENPVPPGGTQTVVSGSEPPAQASDIEKPGHRILVVDDEPSIVRLFKMILENFLPGILVDCAANGAEAVELFKVGRHPVLVMDLHMPVMDGQAAFFALESYCRQEDIAMPAVIFCTGYAPQAPLQQVVAGNPCHLILTKPVQSDVLVQAVRERLESVPVA